MASNMDKGYGIIQGKTAIKASGKMAECLV